MKVLIIDSTGLSDVTDNYRSFFGPHIKLIGHEPAAAYKKVASGEHGYQCGYYAGVLLNLLEGEHELHFARIFDQHDNWIRGVDKFILDVIADVQPDVVSNSWGMDDGDLPWGERDAQRAWASWAARFRLLMNNKKTAVFFAAGNDDKNDEDEDVAFPQRMLPEYANIIGSHNRAGKPSRFSGDGKGVNSVMWGENVALLNKYGKWERGSGTSFACPKAAGLAAYLQLDHYGWRKYVLENATHPDKWSGYLPHPKWGYGSMEYRYQELLAELPDELQPPHVSRKKRTGEIEYMDRKLVA